MDLFYTSSDRIDLAGGTLSVEGDEFFHMTKVLRKKEGQEVYLADGEGLSIKAAIRKVGKSVLTATIIATEQVPPPRTRVTVAISLLKSSQRFDFFLEKATELGITAIVPMITGRTVSQPKEGRIENKLQRWRKVLVSASRQTKRYHLPSITRPLLFDDVLCLESYDMKLLPYELSGTRPCEAPFTGKNVLFMVGGEGGFREEEVCRAREAGFSEISFGRSILRAETAGVFAVAMVRSQVLMNEQPDKWM